MAAPERHPPRSRRPPGGRSRAVEVDGRAPGSTPARAATAARAGHVLGTGRQRPSGPGHRHRPRRRCVVLASSTVTTLQLHVGGGILAMLLTVAHARQRRVRSRGTDLSRRSFVRLAVLTSVAVVLEAGVQATGAFMARRGVRRPTGSFQLASSSVTAIPATSCPVRPGTRARPGVLAVDRDDGRHLPRLVVG